MSDFKNNPNTYLSIDTGANLYNGISNGNLSDVQYDVSTNQYAFYFGDTSKAVNLYSTTDILDYYFGDNLQKDICILEK